MGPPQPQPFNGGNWNAENVCSELAYSCRTLRRILCKAENSCRFYRNIGLWILALLGAILATSTVVAVVFLILTLVFIPVLIIGIVFLIGGIIAATAGGRPPQAMRR